MNINDIVDLTGFQYMGRHMDFKVYGNGYDRRVYKKNLSRGGIKYKFLKQYKAEEYIEPVETTFEQRYLK